MVSYRIDKLQIQNWMKIDFKVEFDLVGNGRLSSETIGTLTEVFCTFGPNMVILAWMGTSYRADKLMIDTRTDTLVHKNAGNDNTQMPKVASGKSAPSITPNDPRWCTADWCQMSRPPLGSWVAVMVFISSLRWIAPNSFSTTASISAQPRWLY